MYIPPNYFHLQVYGTQPGGSGVWLFSCGFEATGVPTVLEFAALMEEAAIELSSAFTVAWDISGARMYYKVLGELAKIEAATPVGGTRNDTADPPNTSVLVKKVTALVGRKHQGRMYLPAPRADGTNDGGLLTAAEAGIFQTAVDDWLGVIQSAAYFGAPVILHQFEADGDPTVIEAFVVQPRVATQRRRLRP
ncbi:MAG TPA: hypothetical protein VJQ57_15850 [Acidimicrobiia bacterium]|nr:hypothetical protein [Acidimicrobiia bacterium]